MQTNKTQYITSENTILKRLKHHYYLFENKFLHKDY